MIMFLLVCAIILAVIYILAACYAIIKKEFTMAIVGFCIGCLYTISGYYFYTKQGNKGIAAFLIGTAITQVSLAWAVLHYK